MVAGCMHANCTDLEYYTQLASELNYTFNSLILPNEQKCKHLSCSCTLYSKLSIVGIIIIIMILCKSQSSMHAQDKM